MCLILQEMINHNDIIQWGKMIHGFVIVACFMNMGYLLWTGTYPCCLLTLNIVGLEKIGLQSRYLHENFIL